MRKERLEIGVGLFLLTGFLAFAYLASQFGELPLFNYGNHYTVQAEFENITGLKKGANVSMAGVQIGRVAAISLNSDDLALVSLELEREVQLSDDAIASVKTQGIIGDKFIKISQGGSDDLLDEGGLITETESALDLEELVSKYIFGKV
ncbi:MAG: outer membrane lipid asymmetry maintenance protein MlaD [Thermodesulfobacteriota bacterium]